MYDRETLFHMTAQLITSMHQVHDAWKQLIPLNDLTPLQYAILEYLKVSGRQSPSSIRACMGISMPNTSRELRKLSEKGYCEKISDAVDRRKHYIQLSEQGEDFMNRAFALMQHEFDKRLAHRDPAELEHLGIALERIQKSLFETGT